MTLILVTVKKHEILVTADGLSSSTKLRNASGRATLQKIFAMPSRSVAIAQCGKNFVDIHCQHGKNKEKSRKKNFEEWLSVFFLRCDLNDVASIARSVRESVRLDDPGFFDDKEDDKEGSHLWVFGYSKGNARPEFYCVSKNSNLKDLLKGTNHADGSITKLTGGGATHLPEVGVEDHDAAWDRVIRRQEEQGASDFGGHMHRLRITTMESTWLNLPMRGTLGLEDWSLKKWGPVENHADDFSDPRCTILLARDELLNAMTRFFEPDRNKPRTYNHLWKKLSAEHPTFDLLDLTDQLIAIYDDAELAHSADVSADDAHLYISHVQRVIRSLPAQTTG